MSDDVVVTRADREAFAREYWTLPGCPRPGTAGHSWLHGHIKHGAWDAAARAVARARAECSATTDLESGARVHAPALQEAHERVRQ